MLCFVHPRWNTDISRGAPLSSCCHFPGCTHPTPFRYVATPDHSIAKFKSDFRCVNFPSLCFVSSICQNGQRLDWDGKMQLLTGALWKHKQSSHIMQLSQISGLTLFFFSFRNTTSVYQGHFTFCRMTSPFLSCNPRSRMVYFRYALARSHIITVS